MKLCGKYELIIWIVSYTCFYRKLYSHIETIACSVMDSLSSCKTGVCTVCIHICFTIKGLSYRSVTLQKDSLVTLGIQKKCDWSSLTWWINSNSDQCCPPPQSSQVPCHAPLHCALPPGVWHERLGAASGLPEVWVNPGWSQGWEGMDGQKPHWAWDAALFLNCQTSAITSKVNITYLYLHCMTYGERSILFTVTSKFKWSE